MRAWGLDRTTNQRQTSLRRRQDTVAQWWLKLGWWRGEYGARITCNEMGPLKYEHTEHKLCVYLPNSPSYTIPSTCVSTCIKILWSLIIGACEYTSPLTCPSTPHFPTPSTLHTCLPATILPLVCALSIEKRHHGYPHTTFMYKATIAIIIMNDVILFLHAMLECSTRVWSRVWSGL
jgi:hypothetical protein